MHAKWRSPFKQKPNVGVSNMVMNEIAMNRIKKVEEKIGRPPNTVPYKPWSEKEKGELQASLNTLKAVRKDYPIPDYSHKKDEYKVK